MKKLKSKDVRYCTYCRASDTRTRAAWRSNSLALSKTACPEHRQDLQRDEARSAAADSHMSEADHQTWGRF